MGIQAAKTAAIKVSRLEGQLLRLRKEVERCQAEIRAIEEKLAAFRIVMPELADGELVPALPPRAPSKPKDGSLAYGERARMILDYLRRQEGKPATTMEIVAHILNAKDIVLPSMAEREEFRRRVKHRLREYEKKGLVERRTTSQETSEVSWQLKLTATTPAVARRLSALPSSFPVA
ncbi:hypothetical protein CS8_090290 [Cupriavidus sp. 8B]